MNPIIVVVLMILVAGIAIFFTVYYSHKAKIKRKLKNAAYREIKYFNSGETAKIVGTVEFVDSPIIAPLSGRECSHYSVLIEQRVKSGKSSHWKTIVEEEFFSKYVIKQGSSYAFIADDNLISHIVLDKNFSSGLFKDATENLKNYLQTKGIDSEGFFGMNKTLRYKEGILEDGEQIAVYGKGEWRNSEDMDLPLSYERILVITAPDNDSVYISDDPDTLNNNLSK